MQIIGACSSVVDIGLYLDRVYDLGGVGLYAEPLSIRQSVKLGIG